MLSLLSVRNRQWPPEPKLTLFSQIASPLSFFQFLQMTQFLYSPWGICRTVIEQGFILQKGACHP